MYLLSIAAVFVTLVILSTVSGSSFLGALRLFDVPSLLVLLLLSVPVIVSSGTVTDFANAFPLALGKKSAGSFAELKRSRVAVETAMKSFVYSALFISMLDVILVLRMLDSLTKLGPSVASMVMTLAMAFLFNLLLVPIKARLKLREIEFMQ